MIGGETTGEKTINAEGDRGIGMKDMEEHKMRILKSSNC
jgi:hypothetical protein